MRPAFVLAIALTCLACLAGFGSLVSPDTGAGGAPASSGDNPGTGTSADPEECAVGCSVGNHPITPLTSGEYRDLLEELASGDEDVRARAIETLLFHGENVRKLLAEHGPGPLPPHKVNWLRRELSRTHVRLWLRVVDETGIARVSIDAARFPVGRKEHVHAESTVDLQPPEISGTVHRTGVAHLWARL